MGPPGTSIGICVYKHGIEPVENYNSHIFVYSTFGKGKSLFYLLTKTTYKGR
jgi:hypothetical protein